MRMSCIEVANDGAEPPSASVSHSPRLIEITLAVSAVTMSVIESIRPVVGGGALVGDDRGVWGQRGRHLDVEVGLPVSRRTRPPARRPRRQP